MGSGQSLLHLIQRVSLGQRGKDTGSGEALVRPESLVRGDGLSEVGERILLRLELVEYLSLA